MADEPLVWTSAVESLFIRALRGRLTQELIQKIRTLGIDLEKPLHPAYPWEIWVAAIEVTGATLYPELPRPQAHFELGKRTIVSYQETLVGKATFAALRLLAPRRILNRLSRSFRTSNNFTETSLTEIGPGQVELRFNRVEPEASFTEGVLAAGLPVAGIPSARVSLARRDGLAAVFRVEWTE